MMRCKQVFPVLALVAPLAVAAVVASPVASFEAKADSGLPDLCSSTQGACTIVPKTEALLVYADVCWAGEEITLMGLAGCTTGRAYRLVHGYIDDPIANTVVAQKPVPDACDLGYCVKGKHPGGVLDEGPACCDPKTQECKEPQESGVCGFGEITWCKDKETNGDGTVTCHE